MIKTISTGLDNRNQRNEMKGKGWKKREQGQGDVLLTDAALIDLFADRRMIRNEYLQWIALTSIKRRWKRDPHQPRRTKTIISLTFFDQVLSIGKNTMTIND